MQYEGLAPSSAWRRPRRRLLVVGGVAAALAVAWWLTPYPRGALAAWADHARGHLEVKVYGEPCPWDHAYARLLKERYGVEFNRVAYCVVTPGLVSYVRGYNSISVPRLNGRFGRDIFGECAAEAEAAWTQEHGAG
jgi:hypothetical protein